MKDIEKIIEELRKSGYFVSEHFHPALTTDCVIFSYYEGKLVVLLVERGNEPFVGQWALPGGFLKVEIDESAEDCALRELEEETHYVAKKEDIFQIGAYSDKNRDPREWVVTIAFIALVPYQEVKGGDDARNAKWFTMDEVKEMKLAFDHDKIFADARQHLRDIIESQPVATKLLGETFSMPDMQNLYEQVFETKFDRRNFAKKMLSVLTPQVEQAKNNSLEMLYDEDLCVCYDMEPPVGKGCKSPGSASRSDDWEEIGVGACASSAPSSPRPKSAHERAEKREPREEVKYAKMPGMMPPQEESKRYKRYSFNLEAFKELFDNKPKKLKFNK